MVDGLRPLVDGLDQVADQLADAVGTAVAEVVVDEARPGTPVLTGRTRDNLTAVGPTIVAATPYAAILHARNPWITRAAGTSTAQQETAAERAAQQLLDQIG